MSHIEKMRGNIAVMNALSGYSVIIVCCSNAHLSNYWQKRLEMGRGSTVAQDAIVLTVFEDWPGGAGNGLGTLYAFQNAAILARERHGLDLLGGMKEGALSVALYHTAGKGTRLAPLPGSENNNKPGVKLPAIITVGGKAVPMTILESVIKQTGSYASSRRGRLSVFWGDQIFIPTVDVAYTPDAHADILCSLGPMMDAAEWAAKGMDKYGLIACTATSCAQVEKVSHATAVALLSNLGGEIDRVGVSLGSFSVSTSLLATLLDEFAAELATKKGKLDTDPHFWMPMTLERAAYLSVMESKKVAADEAGAHFDRMQAMLQRAPELTGGAGSPLPRLFNACDVGRDIYWWDYGQLRFYEKNAALVNANNQESELMRMFFGIDAAASAGSEVGATNSCVLASTVAKAADSSVKDSVVCRVQCGSIRAEGAVVMNCVARNITAGKGAIAYNITTDADITLADGEVVVGLYKQGDNGGVMTSVRSSLDIDGGVYWDKVAPGNELTFGQIYEGNASADPEAVEALIEAMREEKWASMQNK